MSDAAPTTTVITVRGEHEIRRAPERATVRLAVQAEGRDRQQVVDQVVAWSDPIRAELEGWQQDGTLHEWTSRRVAVWSDRPWNSEGRQLALVHHASVDLTATFTDFAAMSLWITVVAARDGVQVGDVSWALSPETAKTVETDAATQAVSVAVARATAYAQAVGLKAVAPLEIADQGLLSRSEASAPAPRAMRMMAASAPGGGPELQLQPEDIVVTAAVEARFAAS